MQLPDVLEAAEEAGSTHEPTRRSAVGGVSPRTRGKDGHIAGAGTGVVGPWGATDPGVFADGGGGGGGLIPNRGGARPGSAPSDRPRCVRCAVGMISVNNGCWFRR